MYLLFGVTGYRGNKSMCATDYLGSDRARVGRGFTTRVPLISACPTLDSVKDISVFHSTKAIFCTPSNDSGIEGLYRETIRSTPRWQTSGITAPRQDCVLIT